MKIFSIILLFTITTGSLTTEQKLYKKWDLSAIEEFGEKWAVGDLNKDDFLHLNEDNNFSMTLYGEEKNGTWKFNENAKTLHFKSDSGNLYFKFINVSDTSLLVEYQQPSLIRSKLHYKAVK